MIAEAIQKVEAGEHLARREAEAAMEELLSGRASDAQIVALLAALHHKGETVDELVGFAAAMRRHAEPIFDSGRAPEGVLVDTCGTGGDAKGTFNVSSAAAFVVAGAGVRVAKHGNRSISSRCGSADVIEALGVNLNVPPERIGAAIGEIGIGFLFAPAVHAAMRHAIAARRQLGGRTVFNLLGPLTNPAGASVQVLGVFDERWLEPLASALTALGVERAFIVHGTDGLDEISLSGPTHVAEAQRGTIRRYSVAPEDFGLARAPLEALAGGDATRNAAMIRKIFQGEPGPRRDIVLANAAPAVMASGLATNFLDAARVAAESIDSGAALDKLEQLVAFTQQSEG